MRRTLSLSLENFQRNNEQIISLEEEQILLTDAVELASDIDQELNEANRIVEISDALEDLAVIADQIEVASPTEIALMETAGDMAVAGTDIEAEEVVPSLEAYRGKRIAAESFRQTAAQIWKNIQEFLKKIWEKITKFFSNIYGVIPNTRNRLDKLKDKIEKIQSLSPRGTTFEVDTKTGGVGSIITRLSVGGNIPKNDNEFIAELKKIHEFTKFVYGASIVNRNSLGVSIADSIERFNPDTDLDGQARLIIDACQKYNATQRFPGQRKTFVESGSNHISRSEELLGGGSLIYKIFTQSDKVSTLGIMDRLHRSGILFDNINYRSGAYRDKTILPTLTQTTLLSMIQEIHEILNLLEEYKKGAASKAVETTRKRLEAASKKASSKNEQEIAANGESVQTSYLKAMLNFNIAYNRWISNPAIPFARYLLSEINALMAYIGMCIKVIEQGQKEQ